MNQRQARRPARYLLLLSLALAGCADLNARADIMAQAASLRHEHIATDNFVLTAFVRITRHDLPLTIYVEGDGMAWRSRNEPSADPTPRKAMGLALAAADLTPNVVYLARPCQYTPRAANPSCEITYWTDKRYSEKIVRAINQAVAHYAAQVPGQRLHLVGFSGGGALVVLVAARRSDVASLRTVAGNLDHVAVNRHHKVSAMPESLNAIDVAKQVAAIPQIHFTGENDQIVPPFIAQRFVSIAGKCAQARLVQGMSHDDDWNRLWPELLAIIPSCSME